MTVTGRHINHPAWNRDPIRGILQPDMGGFSGPPGWSLMVCEIDLRVGGAYRFAWRGPDGAEMGMGGVFREIVPPERFVATERFDKSWYRGEAQVTQALVALKTPMEKGMAPAYERLAELLASLR